LAFGDDAFEAAVFEWMIFYLHGKTLIAGKVTKPLGDSPAFQHSIPAKAEIVMKARGGALLNDERKAGDSMCVFFCLGRWARR
jgi:hypothetical protein